MSGSSERDRVVLLGGDGSVLGVADKLDAHRPPGRLHLAFSVLLYRSDGGMLLQRRAADKYHFPGVWANACCSHPQPDEELVASAELRVKEELGVSCALREVGQFIYRAACPTSGLVEHELDHVLIGVLDEPLAPNPHEVAEVRVVEARMLEAALGAQDGARALGLDGGFAPWLAEAVALARPHRPGAAR